MSEHQCFTVSTTAYLHNSRPDRDQDVIAVYYEAPPRKNGNGTTSYSMIAPVLVVTDYMADPEGIAQRVAEILNQHWDRDPEEEKKLRAYGVLLNDAFEEVARASQDLPAFVSVEEYSTEIALKDGSNWTVAVRRSDDG